VDNVEQPEKQELPIDVTDIGIITPSNNEQPEKHDVLINVKLVVFKVTFVKLLQPLKHEIPNWFSNDPDVQINSVITVAISEKTPSAILVTESGIVAIVDPTPLSVTPIITLFEIS
jgi:hypothetical protein